jgi:hypothetical protein
MTSILVYCYLIICFLYSLYISKNLEGEDVPLYRVIIFSLFCPWFLATHVLCFLLSKIGVHIVIGYGVETNTSENLTEEE